MLGGGPTLCCLYLLGRSAINKVNSSGAVESVRLEKHRDCKISLVKRKKSGACAVGRMCTLSSSMRHGTDKRPD